MSSAPRPALRDAPRVSHKLVDQGLCSVVHARLAGVTPCALRMTDVLISQCPDTAVMSVERCAPYEACTFSPENSFTYQPGTAPGGTVVAFVCTPDPPRATAAFVATCVAAVALLVLALLGARAMTGALERQRTALVATLPQPASQ